MTNKDIFLLAPGLEEKMNEILGKYEESIKRRQLKENNIYHSDDSTKTSELMKRSLAYTNNLSSK